MKLPPANMRICSIVMLACILLAGLKGYAQPGSNPATRLGKDSLSYNFEEHWRFFSGDDTAFANFAYDDSKWTITESKLSFHVNKENAFKGLGWLRLHIIADSSITGRPLVLYMEQLGASEIYLDGKLVKKYGRISSIKDSCVYFDPHSIPFVILMNEPGEHVLAVRYANYNAKLYHEKYVGNDPGFSMSIGEANRIIYSVVDNTIMNTFIFSVLFGVFVALSLVHLLLFLYYKAERSNIYFSLFCLSIAAIFFIPFLNRTTQSPELEIKAGVAMFYVASLACFSMSGFINQLFSKSKLRFFIIALFCFSMPVIYQFEPYLVFYGIFFLATLVCFEAVVLIFIALVNKKRGAWIIASGFFLLAGFVLTVFIMSMMNISFHLNYATPDGKVLVLLLCGAILSLPISMSAYLAWKFSTVNKDLSKQLKQVQVLNEKTLQQEQEKKRLLETQNEELEKQVAVRTAEVVKQHDELKHEKKKSDDLLLNILPEEVAEELKQKGTSEARYFDKVSVLFTDFVNFTKAGERMSPQELVNELDTCFKAFDGIISKYGIEKIKTIGDAYLAVSGLPVANEQHAVHMVQAAMEIRDYMAARRQQYPDKTFEIRIGIHSGSVVAGIVGVKKFAYDIWGDTVNTAARMEQHGEAGKINISQSTYELVNTKFACTHRGQISAKNKGELNMYFVERELSA